jgi:hypothetical protein
MGWVEHKLALFSDNLEHFAGAYIRDLVMKGSEGLSGDSDIDELAQWMTAAMDRLVLMVDEETARKIMTRNACRFIEETFLGDTAGALARLRAEYRRSSDIDKIIEMMNADKSYNGGSMFPRYERKGSTLYNTKKPCRADAYAQARTDYEKQLSYCFCPFVRAAKDAVQPVYCNCGAAFNKYIWEEIVEGEVRTEVVTSVLTGGDSCRFAIYLPDF